MHVTDDRGKQVRLIQQRKLGTFPGVPSPIPLAVRERMHMHGHEIQWSREVLIPLVIGLIVAAMWGGLWFYLAPRATNLLPAAPVIRGLVIGLVPSLPLPFVMYVMIHAGRKQVARLVTRYGYCASCGYALTKLPVDEDSCTVCPECGSAWKVPPQAADAPQGP